MVWCVPSRKEPARDDGDHPKACWNRLILVTEGDIEATEVGCNCKVPILDRESYLQEDSWRPWRKVG